MSTPTSLYNIGSYWHSNASQFEIGRWSSPPTIAPTTNSRFPGETSAHVDVGSNFCHLVILTDFESTWKQCSILKSSMPFKQDLALQNIPLSKHPSSKRNPELKMKTSCEVLNLIYPLHAPTNVAHCHYKKWG